jgi:hypothetical protein
MVCYSIEHLAFLSQMLVIKDKFHKDEKSLLLLVGIYGGGGTLLPAILSKIWLSCLKCLS